MNIKKIVLYLIANDFSEIILIAVSILLGLPLPILPAQILWINIIEDALPSLALTLEPGDKDVMQARAGPQKLFDKTIKSILILIAVCTGISSFLLFFILLKVLGADHLDKIRTMVFAMNAGSSLLFVFVCSCLNKTVFSKCVFKNHWLISACLIGFILLIFAVYAPFMQTALKTVALDLTSWLIIICVIGINLVLIDAFKRRLID